MWEVWLWAALCSGLVLSAPRLGESTELAWLLVHDAPQQSPLLLRRITPKSVFLTPTFTSCSEGYRQDGMGRCVKVVKIDQQAQWEFFLQKLNSMYGAPEPSRKENTGPLKLPIPIEEEPASTTLEPTTTTEPTTAATTPAPVVTTLQTTTAQTTTEQPTPQPTTEQPFLIVVANTTDPMETDETTVIEVTSPLPEETSLSESSVSDAPAYDTSASDTSLSDTSVSEVFPSEPSSLEPSSVDPSTQQTTEELAESVVTESLIPVRNTVRFPVPDGRKRPSSYIRFPEHYASAIPPPSYWWPHSWERTQVAWPPQNYRHSYQRPHWSSTSF